MAAKKHVKKTGCPFCSWLFSELISVLELQKQRSRTRGLYLTCTSFQGPDPIYVQCAVHACDQQAASQTLFDLWEIVLAFGIMDQHGLCIGRVLHLEGISQLQSSPSQGLLAWSYKFCSFKPLNARLFLLCKDCQGILLIDFAKWEISWKLNNFSGLWAVGEALLAYNDCKSSGGWILDP